MALLVVLILDVADQLLDQVLQRHDAGRAAVFVDHDGQVGAVPAHLRQGRHDGLAGRQHLHRPLDVTDPSGPVAAGIEQVTGVHEADHVVVGVFEDGKPRVRRPRRDRDSLGHRHRGGQEVDFRPGHEDLADLPGARVEDLADDVPFVGRQVLVPSDQVTQLVAAHRAAADLRVAAEHPHHEVHAAADQPDHRPGQRGDPVEHGRGDERDALLPLQRDPLRHQLAEYQREERDDQRDHDEREDVSHVRGEVPGQHLLEIVGQGRSAVRAGRQGGHRDADLDGGQEPVRVMREPRRSLTALPALPERPHLALAQRHQCHLGGGEEAADENEGEDDQYVPADAIHVASLISAAGRGSRLPA